MHPDSRTLLADLSIGLIRVSGADASAFLQGQLSTDLDNLTQEQAQISSWNNAKGRVVTLLHVFRRDGDIYLALPEPLFVTVLKRLSMYVLRSKVTLTDASDQLACLGLMGAQAPALLAAVGIKAPADFPQMTTQGAVQVVRLYGQEPRFALMAPPDDLRELRQKLVSAGAGPTDTWALHRILAGEPAIYPETSEYFVAQMLDLDNLGGIDFKKGCYIGQEVIARAHYRGAVKRHLARATSSSTAPLPPGTDIHTPGHDSPVAEVVDAKLDGNGVWQMLLVVQDDFRDKELVHGASGAAVTLI